MDVPLITGHPNGVLRCPFGATWGRPVRQHISYGDKRVVLLSAVSIYERKSIRQSDVVMATKVKNERVDVPFGRNGCLAYPMLTVPSVAIRLCSYQKPPRATVLADGLDRGRETYEMEKSIDKSRFHNVRLDAIYRHGVASAGSVQKEPFRAANHHAKQTGMRWLQWWRNIVDAEENVV